MIIKCSTIVSFQLVAEKRRISAASVPCVVRKLSRSSVLDVHVVFSWDSQNWNAFMTEFGVQQDSRLTFQIWHGNKFDNARIGNGLTTELVRGAHRARKVVY
jgi:hypothetical protein